LFINSYQLQHPDNYRKGCRHAGIFLLRLSVDHRCHDIVNNNQPVHHVKDDRSDISCDMQTGDGRIFHIDDLDVFIDFQTTHIVKHGWEGFDIRINCNP